MLPAFLVSRYIKQLKMEILTLIASSTNVYDIVGELTEYARDISADTARLAVKAVGRIALSVRTPVHHLAATSLLAVQHCVDAACCCRIYQDLMLSSRL